MNSGDIPLIRTKLAPPRIGGAPISRTLLLQQLDARRDRKLSLALGPAGCGKTMLLTQWRRQLCTQGARVAWYNAGPDDDDSDIAAYVIESLRQAGLPMDSGALQLFGRTGAKAWKPLLSMLVNDLAAYGEDVYLFIDDFHHVSSFGVLRLIDRLLTLAPPGFRLVLGSRVRPPLELARLIAEDQVTEFRFGDLRFSLEETQRFATAQGLQQLNMAQVSALQEMTDGWAAGLQMLAFALRKEKSPVAFFAREGRTSLAQEDALDRYLEKAAIEHLAQGELGFLTRISSCRRFNRELCELLTGDPRAAEYLARFEAENLFLLPIDTSDAEPWYRFHPLFAAFLNKRLRQLDAADLRKLHQLASHWFAGKSLHVEALRHARLAGDTDFLLELIDRAARRLLNGANFLELLKWCALVPRERLATRLEVCLCAAWAQLTCSRTEEFDRLLADIERHPDSGSGDAGVEVRLLKAYRYMQQDDSAAALRITDPMLRVQATANPLQTLLLCHIGSLALVYANEFERARDVARIRYRQEIPEREDHTRPLVDVMPGFSYLMQGNIRLAIAALAPIVDDAARIASRGADVAGLFGGYFLEAYYQAGQLQQARAYLDRFADVIDAVGAADAILFAYRVRARLERLDGDAGASLRTLQRLEEIGYRKGLDRLIAWSLHDQILLALASRQAGPVPELRRRLTDLAQRYGEERSCVWAEIPLAHKLASAEIAAADAIDSECLAQIAAAEETARANRRELLCARLNFMRAMAQLRAGQTAAALELGRRTLQAAIESGMSRLLLDLGPDAVPLAKALYETHTDAPALSYLEQVWRPDPAANQTAAPDAATSPSAALLSARELEVLGLLSRALSTKSIARTLDLSSGTVKWHLKNVYGKLHAVSREDALAKARALGILR